MYKLVVLFALVAVAVAKPGGLAYSAPAVLSAAVLPSAVSSSYRTDIHSSPLIATYAAPAVVAAPVVQKTIVAAAPVVLPSAVSSTYRKDIITPSVTAYAAAPAVVAAPLVAAPVVQKAYVAAPVALPAAVSSSYRSDVIDSKPVITGITYGAYAPAAKAW